MNNFRKYFNEQVTVGLIEYIDINGIGKIKAKIDSGNQGYNVIHGINLTDIGDNKVKFQTINNQTVSFIKQGEIQVQAGQENETRPVINLSFKLGDQFYENIPFSVSDRTKSDEQVLIGEPFLKRINAVIDVNKEQLHESEERNVQIPKPAKNELAREQFIRLMKFKKKVEEELSHLYNEDQFTQSKEYIETSRLYYAVKEKLEELKPISFNKGRAQIIDLKRSLA